MTNYYAKTGLTSFNIKEGGGGYKRPVKQSCKTRSFITLCVCLLGLYPLPGRTQELQGLEPTRIVVDQDKKSFIFLIDNQPVALLDKEGLHVVGGINYGDSLTDTGSTFIKNKIVPPADVSEGDVE